MILAGKVYLKKWKVPIYATSVWIVIGATVSQAVDAVEDYVHFPILAPEERAGTYGFTYQYSDSTIDHRIIIILPADCAPGTIAHEAYHVVNFIFSYHGIKADRNNDEAGAYLIDTVVTGINAAIKQFKERVPKKRA